METEGFAIYDAMMQLKNEVDPLALFASSRLPLSLHPLITYVVSCSMSLL